MNRRVLPASCRQRNRRKALPTRRRQHLVGGTVRLVRGSWSQCMRKIESGLSMNLVVRKTPPADAAEDFLLLLLLLLLLLIEERRVRVRLRVRVRQNRGSWSQSAPKMASRLSMNLVWFGVPPSGGSNCLDRLEPGVQAVSGFMVPM